MNSKLQSDILIIDDEIRLAQNLQTLLGWEGYQTRITGNSTKGLELIKDHPPSIVITDIMMPNLDGYELLAYLKNNYPHIPVIVMTGFGSLDSAIKALQAGAFDYILKPFDHGLIIQTVQRAVEHARRNLYRKFRQEMTMALGSTLSFQPMLEQVLNLSQQAVGAENSSLFIPDETGEIIYATLQANVTPPQSREAIIKQVMSEGLAGWVYQNRQCVIIDDIDHDDRWIKLPNRPYQVHSVLSIPFVSRDVVQGLIVLVHTNTNYFDELDCEFLKSMALPIAIAIENIALFKRVQEKSEEMATLYQSGLSITSTLDKKTAISNSIKQIGTLIGVDACSIAQWNVSEQKLTPLLSLTFNNTWQESNDLDQFYNQQDYPILQQVLIEQSVVVKYISDFDLTSKEYKWLKLRQVQSLMLYPLSLHGQITGLIALMHTHNEKPFTERDKRLMAGLATQVSIALENVRLFETVATQTAWTEQQAKTLDEERSKLSAILHSITDTVLVIDKHDKIVLANSAIKQAFDLNPTDILNKPYQLALKNTNLEDLFDNVKLQNTSLILEVETNNDRIYYTNIVPVLDIGYVAVLRDITHLKELDKMRVELLSTASHNLKNPLAIIHGYIQVLQESEKLDDYQHDILNRINNVSARMINLIADLLGLARLESGLKLRLVPYSINKLIQDAVSENENLARLKNISINLVFDNILDQAICDPDLLHQVLTNLLSNAIKYTPNGGEVTIKTLNSFNLAINGEDNQEVFIAVKDTGYGIDPEKLARIFKRFYRIKTKETEKIEGTGLGLAIVKRIIEQHGKQIWVESKEGEGSTFTFSLQKVVNNKE